MGEVISLTEASRRYNIGEKTLRKWIRAAGLAEKKPNDQKRMTWEIDTDALERLIREKRTGTPSVDMPVHATSGQGVQVSDLSREQITELAMQLSYQGEMIEALKTELETVKDRVLVLEQSQIVARPKQRRVTLEEVNYRVPAQPAEEGQRVQTRPQATAPPGQELPAGTITLAEMAAQLGINRTTWLGHVKNPLNHIEHVAIEKTSRPGEYSRYFTPEQQEAARAWHKANTKKPQTLWDE